MGRAVKATAFWHEYVPQQDFMWKRMPHVMIAKVAEALALRKCFPWDPTRGIGIGSDVYTTEEMEQADRPPAVTVSVQERVMAKAAGITLREFADAVSDVEPATITAIRDEMFPGVGGVKNLTGVQLLALRDRLLEAPLSGEIIEVDADSGSCAGNGARGRFLACGGKRRPCRQAVPSRCAHLGRTVLVGHRAPRHPPGNGRGRL